MASSSFRDYESLGNTGEIYGARAQVVEGATNDGVLDWRRGSDSSFIDPFDQFEKDEPGDFGELQNSLLQIDYEIGNTTLTLLAGHSKFDWDYLVDLDTSAAPILDAAIDENYEQTSGEVRLTSDWDGAFNFIVGGYFHSANLFNAQPNIINGAVFVAGVPPVFGASLFELEHELTSFFGYGTYQIGDRWVLTGGLRQYSDDKEVRRNRRCGFADRRGWFCVQPGNGDSVRRVSQRGVVRRFCGQPVIRRCDA